MQQAREESGAISVRSSATGIPRHIGIIMDGNGRWATQRGMRRTKGHREGVEAAKRIVLEAIDMGVEHLTLYAFSTENWRRAQQEVSFLMALLATHLRDQYDFYRDNNVKVRHVGDIAGLPNEVRSEIDRTALETASNTAITVTLAVNYGGRDEIVRAVNRWIDSCNGDLGRHLCADELRAHLDHDDIPDPDLVIRTGGEQRISNFLLWECAYAELYFSQRLLPDWDAADLREAVDAFCARKRNFGGMR